MMKCPKCNNEMVKGRVHIGGGMVTHRTGALSLENLTFTGAHWGEHVLVQDASDDLTAHFCCECRVVTIETRR